MLKTRSANQTHLKKLPVLFSSVALAFSLAACAIKKQIYLMDLTLGARLNTPVGTYHIKGISKSGLQIVEYPNGEGIAIEKTVPFDSSSQVGMAKVSVHTHAVAVAICIGKDC